MMNLFFDTLVFGPMCLYELGVNPFTIEKMTAQASSCLENINMGDVDGGGEGGLDWGLDFPMPDGEIRTKVCVDVSSFAKTALCMSDIKADFINTEFRNCLNVKKIKFLDQKSLSVEKQTRYGTMIKEQNRKKCLLTNRVSDRKLKMNIGLTSASISYSDNYKELQIERINDNSMLSQLRKDYIANELNGSGDNIFENIIKPLSIFTSGDSANNVSGRNIRAGYEFVLKSWFYGAGNLMLARSGNGSLFPYVKMGENTNGSTQSYSSVNSGYYNYDIGGLMPSTSFIELRTLPETLPLKKRFEAVDIFCSRMQVKLGKVLSSNLEDNSESSKAFKRWFNGFSENVYFNIFMVNEGNAPFKVDKRLLVPHGGDRIRQKNLDIFRKTTNSFCSEMKALSSKFYNFKNKIRENRKNLDNIMGDFLKKKVLKERNEEEKLKRVGSGEQLVDTPAQQEIKRVLGEEDGIMSGMQSEIDLFDEPL